MIFKNKKIFLVTTLFLGGCLSQPKAPIIDGLGYTSVQPVNKKNNIKYNVIEETKLIEEKIYHTVEKGEYIYSIARKYHVSPQSIIKNNSLKKPYKVFKGDKLFIKTDKKRIVVKSSSNNSYSLTNKYKAGNSTEVNTNRIFKSLPVQDLNRPSKDKNVDFGYHKVRKGENLFRIGQKYDVSVFDLMAYNDLKRPEELKAGSELKIPVAKNTYTPEEIKKGDSGNLEVPLIDKETAKRKGFVYPVKGRVVSKFGVQGHGVRNDGIDISTPIGTPVRASQQGQVMYAQSISSLGEMVLIKHSSGYISAYTHNSKLLVNKGDKVAKGQVIAMSGNTGNAKQPMLHFELRRYGKAIDPLRVLH